MEASDVIHLGEELDLLRPITDGADHLEAEVAWAAREELAVGLDDMLVRRTRLALELPDRAASVAPRVAAILGTELGWDEDRQGDEVARFLEGAHRAFDVPPAEVIASAAERTAAEAVVG